ncbi:MAG TPA: tol-pal system protein YbgF [Caulobacteraceae bacterium]|jgi:tol-pal system protein YbgF|nr:tol-pal system protein YbgF [Caulobacteraceae bacterium]
MAMRLSRKKAPVLAGAALSVVLLLGGALPAPAQVPLDPLDDRSAKRLDRMEQALREIRAIVFQGRETGRPVVVEPADTDSQLSAIGQKIDDLQQSVTRITGQLESAEHDVDEARREAGALREENGALKARIAALEEKAAPPPVAAVTPPAPDAAPPPPTDPAALMAAARESYNAGDFAAAETGFHDLSQKYGSTPRGMEAKYYLGKLMLKRGAYADAAAMDLGVVRQWPATAWAPDAALDLARAMVGMKESREACGVLTQVDSHYPKASASVRNGEADVRAQAGCDAG